MLVSPELQTQDSATNGRKETTDSRGDNIFASVTTKGVESLEHLGQGLHALQDAIAHRGVRTSDHLGANWSSAKKFVNDAYGSTWVASNLTRSALIVIDVLKGNGRNLKDGEALDLRGMSGSQLDQFMQALLKKGFIGRIKNQQD